MSTCRSRVLDEPTVGLDPIARDAVWLLVVASAIGIITASRFLRRLIA